MSVNFFQRIAFRLARASILCALAIGFISAIVQVVVDLRQETQRIENRVVDIFEGTADAARLAAFQQNTELANDIVTGLSQQAYLGRIELFDRDYNSLGFAEQTETASWLSRELSEFVANKTSLFRFPLLDEQGEVDGFLHLEVNNGLAMEPFLGRALYVFLSGLFWYATLAVLLFYVSNRIITAPMKVIAGRIAKVDTGQPQVGTIEHAPGHEHDELGHIVRATNAFIKAVDEKQSGLREHQQQIHLIMDNSPNQVVAVNARNTMVFVNNKMADFYGVAASTLIGRNYIDLHARIDPEQAELIREELDRVRQAGRSCTFQKESLTDAAGNDRLMQVNRTPFRYAGEDCVLTIASDITDLMMAEAGVKRLAYFDALTNLPNRNMVLDRLNMDMKRCRRNQTMGALMVIDVDDFKRINDTMNHVVGDQLLVILAERLTGLIRETDTLARLGGDEFALSAPDLAASMDAAEAEASALASRLIQQLNAPLTLDGQEVIMSASLGIVMFPREGHDADDLLKYADTAMYQAKRLGKNQFRFFRTAMAKEASRLMQLEAELRQAQRQDEFCFYLQPILHGRSRQLVGAEALLRWNHPERGMLGPDSFLGFLESSGMLSDIGRMVFLKICRFIGQYPGCWHSDLRMSVNFSAQEFFQLDFETFIESALADTGVSGQCLEFEITEGAALHNLEEAVVKIERLGRMGISFALDDFGTGYSSLSYLKRLPFDTMKIDKSFIQDLAFDPQDAALVASMLVIAGHMGLRVVAEGVELDAQADWLAEYDNIMYQGYLFSRPIPTAKFVPRFLQIADT